MLPLWLAPTQVRIIPISDKFEKEAKRMAEEIEQQQIRVDVDDAHQQCRRKYEKLRQNGSTT